MLRSILRITALGLDLPTARDGARSASRGVSEREREEMVSLCAPWTDKAMRLRQCYRVADLAGRGTSTGRALGRPSSSLFAPIMTHGTTFGVLHVHRAGASPFSEEDLRMVYTVASQMALAVEYEQLLQDKQDLFLDTLEGLCSALDARDNETHGHSQRVTAYCVEMGRRLQLSPDELEVVKQGALLHDIGKIGIPDGVLNKSGRLTDKEYTMMKQHPGYGHRMLQHIQGLQPAASIVLHHQERYDGEGYPAGLRGEEIVIGARIFAVADAYDAMTSDRCYRKGIGDEDARQEIRRCAGTQFDPRVAEVFLTIPKERLEALRQEVEALSRTSSAHTLLFR